MPLQIFEPRYLDMIKQCLTAQTPFGIVRICHGSEVINAGLQESLDIEYIGTIANIVDFDALPNNRLKIIIEGVQRFTIKETTIAKDQLISAEIELSDIEAPQAMTESHLHLADMLSELVQHSSVKPLGYQLDLNDAVRVGNQLANLLPIETTVKQELLELDSFFERLTRLDEIIDQLQ